MIIILIVGFVLGVLATILRNKLWQAWCNRPIDIEKEIQKHKEQVKDYLENNYQKGDEIYASEVADKLGLYHFVVYEIFEILKDEGFFGDDNGTK